MSTWPRALRLLLALRALKHRWRQSVHPGRPRGLPATRLRRREAQGRRRRYERQPCRFGPRAALRLRSQGSRKDWQLATGEAPVIRRNSAVVKNKQMKRRRRKLKVMGLSE